MSKYIAFISYRHGPADSPAAADVQKRIETYPIPRGLREKAGGRHPGRVFLDKSELSATYDLSDDIKEALRDSRFLIVVCSRYALGSSWIPREIEYFLESHTRKEILTVILDGERSEVVPEIIRRDPEETGDAHVYDPLSCDYRLPRRRIVREEIPRLVSGLIGCGYGDLIDRAARRRRKILAWTLSGAALAALTVISYLLWSNHEISRHYRESQRRYLVNMTAVCSSLAEDRRRLEALSLAGAAMESAPGQEMPAGLYRLLSEETGVYATAYTGAFDGYVNTGCFQTEGSVVYMEAGREGTRLAASDDRGRFYLWDLDSHALLLMLHLESNPGQPAFFGDRVFFLCGSTVWCLRSSDGSVCWQQDCEGLDQTLLMGPGGPVVLAARRILGLDAETGDVLFMNRLDRVPGLEEAYEGGYVYTRLLGMSEDRSRALMALQGGDPRLFEIDGEGNVTSLPGLTEEDISAPGQRELAVSPDGNFYCVIEDSMDTAGLSLVRAFSPEGELRWEYRTDYLSARRFSLHNRDYSMEGRITGLTLTGEYLNVFQAGRLMSLSAETGELMEEIQFTDSILRARCLPGEGAVVLTEDGSVAYRNNQGGIFSRRIGPSGALDARFLTGNVTSDERWRFFYQFDKTILLVTEEDREDRPEEFQDSRVISFGYPQYLEAGGCLYVLAGERASLEEGRKASLICLDPENMETRFRADLLGSYGMLLLGYDAAKDLVYAADDSLNKVWQVDGKTGDYKEIRVYEEDEYKTPAYHLLEGQILVVDRDMVMLMDPDSGEKQMHALARPLKDADMAVLQEDGSLLALTQDLCLCRIDPRTGDQDLMEGSFPLEAESSGCRGLLTCESEDTLAWAIGSQYTVRLIGKKTGLVTDIQRAAQSPAAIGLEGEEVLILYQDGILNRHRASDGAFLGSLDLEKYVNEGASFRKDQEGRILITEDKGIWVLDQRDWSVRAWIDGAAAYDEKRNSCFLCLYDPDKEYEVRFGMLPVRSPEELLEIAGQITGGGVLTREQMDLYGLQE